MLAGGISSQDRPAAAIDGQDLSGRVAVQREAEVGRRRRRSSATSCAPSSSTRACAPRSAAGRASRASSSAPSGLSPLVGNLRRFSPEFAALWRDNEVRGFGEGVKRLRHSTLGPLSLEYSAFAVDGRPDLTMVVYNPATSADADKIGAVLARTAEGEGAGAGGGVGMGRGRVEG